MPTISLCVLADLTDQVFRYASGIQSLGSVFLLRHVGVKACFRFISTGLMRAIFLKISKTAACCLMTITMCPNHSVDYFRTHGNISRFEGKRSLEETSDSVVVSFDVPDGLKGAFAFQAGQYLTLKTTIGGEEVRRSYSLCSARLLKERGRWASKKCPEASSQPSPTTSSRLGRAWRSWIPGSICVERRSRPSPRGRCCWIGHHAHFKSNQGSAFCRRNGHLHVVLQQQNGGQHHVSGGAAGFERSASRAVALVSLVDARTGGCRIAFRSPRQNAVPDCFPRFVRDVRSMRTCAARKA